MNRGFLSKWTHSDASSQTQVNALRREMLIGYVPIGITAISGIAFCIETYTTFAGVTHADAWRAMTDLIIGRSLFAFFLFCGLIYQLTRLGYLKRFAQRHSTPRAELERIYAGDPPSLAVLIPSYKEEPRVVRQTLLAAVLQQSPNRRVVLLIDDPPLPRNRDDAAKLAEMRNLPREINTLLAAPALRLERELSDFMRRQKEGVLKPAQEVERLATLLRDAADWLDGLADDTAVTDHNDALFVERILRVPARAHRSRAFALAHVRNPERVDLLREYRRLAALFRTEVTSFERKRYANLSHEPNKAMNLNSYLALMGKGFCEVQSPNGWVLEETDDSRATLVVPAADFIVVLDADSLILSEYSLRLIHFMTEPGNERIAVVQTPYASVPGAANEIEHIAGATTDVQLMAHQGATLFGAGSWVGASALVRRAALEDIAVTVEERGYPVLQYVRDRTLTEDTDTSVALIRRNWTVYNYPDRLAYSATPSDFGSLLIQRRRWATGGLIILANVCRYVFDQPSPRRLWEGLIRAHYILSGPLGSMATVTLVLFPFDSNVWSLWPMPAFLAYLATFGRDLRHNGNRNSDLFRAMALNAMLLPINLAGAVNSLHQLVTGRKIPFQRTPKVRGRTAATPAHIAAQIGLLLFACIQVPERFAAADWFGFLFYLFYAAAFGYVLHVYIGWHAAAQDLFSGLRTRLAPRRIAAPGQAQVPRWIRFVQGGTSQ